MNCSKLTFSLSLLAAINFACAMEMNEDNNNNNQQSRTALLNKKLKQREELAEMLKNKKTVNIIHVKKNVDNQYYMAFFSDGSSCLAKKEKGETKYAYINLQSNTSELINFQKVETMLESEKLKESVENQPSENLQHLQSQFESKQSEYISALSEMHDDDGYLIFDTIAKLHQHYRRP